MAEIAPVSLLRVITRLNVGGPARQALLLAKALRPEFDTVLVAGNPPPLEGELTDPEVAVTKIALTRAVSPAADIRSLVALRHLVAQHRPLLIHTHMAKAGTLARMSLGAAPSRPRTVHTFHGHVLEGYFSPRVSRMLISVERYLARRTDALVAVSPQVRDYLLGVGIGEPSQWRVIPLGLDLSSLLALEGPSGRLREHLGLGPDVPLVGTLGRLATIKDHPTLIRAVARIPDVHLAILGDGEMRAAIEEIIVRSELAERVHLVGWWTDVASAIADMDVVALSSLNEGTPVSLIEAAAAARPVVATDVGGVRFVVIPDETGLLVPPGDAAAIASALKKVLDDRGLAQRLGRAGRDHVHTRFSGERLVADMRSLYMDLLSKDAGVTR